jgi:hypothetical protein
MELLAQAKRGAEAGPKRATEARGEVRSKRATDV